MVISSCSSKLLLPQQNGGTHPIRDNSAIPLWIVLQHRFQLRKDIFSRQLGQIQLLTVQCPDCSCLPVKCRAEGTGTLCRDQGLRLNVHGGCPHIGKQARTVIKDGAIVIFTATFQDRDIVQMTVIV